MTAVDLASTERADELLRSAHDAGYRFPSGFGGFAATLTVLDATTEATGRMSVDEAATVDVSLGGEDDLAAWARRELSSMAAHRRHRSYEDADGRHAKRAVPEDSHPLGAGVELDDDLASSFRVREGQIAEITRSHGGSKFTIVIQNRITAPDGRTVSTDFTVSYWDEESGRLRRVDTYADRYVERDGILLPTSRQVATSDDDGLVVRRLELSDHVVVRAES